MTHGFIYRVHETQALNYSAWSSRKVAATPVQTEDVVAVHVRIRQKNTGFLYRCSGDIEKIPLTSYQPGEHLDCYV